MNPHVLCDNLKNEEETFSFLPRTSPPPVNQITIKNDDERGTRSNKRRMRRKKKEAFCTTRMIRSISLMMIVTFIVILANRQRWDDYNTSSVRATDWEVQQWRDLKLSDIGNWCLDSNVTTCKCASPLTPKSRHGHKTWTEAHLQNIQNSLHYADRKNSEKLDVIFLGDSITEGWMGTSFGEPLDQKKSNKQVFQKLFVKSAKSKAKFNGFVLAMAGDKSPNLLWRMQNGEIPDNLNADVWWILIGTNDFLKDGLDNCSDEVVLMGVRRIVEEMKLLRPSSKIVVNGILPRSGRSDGLLFEPGGKRNVMNAIQDVNRELRAYCEQHENVEYFDASDLFIKENKKVGYEYIPEALMSDHLHPTTLGYERWGERIVEKLHNITVIEHLHTGFL